MKPYCFKTRKQLNFIVSNPLYLVVTVALAAIVRQNPLWSTLILQGSRYTSKWQNNKTWEEWHKDGTWNHHLALLATQEQSLHFKFLLIGGHCLIVHYFCSTRWDSSFIFELLDRQFTFISAGALALLLLELDVEPSKSRRIWATAVDFSGKPLVRSWPAFGQSF